MAPAKAWRGGSKTRHGGQWAHALIFAFLLFLSYPPHTSHTGTTLQNSGEYQTLCQPLLCVSG